MFNRNRLLVILLVSSIFLFSCQALSAATDISPTSTVVPQPAVETSPPAQAEVVPTVIVEPQATEVTIIDKQVPQESTLIEIYENSNPGVVAIQVLTSSGNGLGSGFVIDKDGHIITNYHVIEGVSDFEVDFPSGFKTRGEVLGTDTDSDLAVLKVDAPPEELHPLPLGDSSKLKVGQTVVAIGSPFRFKGTMTTGIVSSVGRTLESLRAAPGGNFFTAGDIIQTDAAINPGNSGGPLLNLNGEVIGVNRAIETYNQNAEADPLNSGIGFAIAINTVKRVVPSLINDGNYDYPYLGITSLPEINLVQQEALGLSQSNGAYVTSVTTDSPADQAGLRGGSQETDIFNLLAGGDLIIAIDGLPIMTFSDLLTYLIQEKSPGDIVTLTILRGEQEVQLELTLGKRP